MVCSFHSFALGSWFQVAGLDVAWSIHCYARLRYVWSFVGWEGIGVCSFALVFLEFSIGSHKSSVKAVLVNRLGDRMLVLAILWCFWHGGQSCLELMCYDSVPSWWSVAFLLGSVAKSAQFDWAVWLADDASAVWVGFGFYIWSLVLLWSILADPFLLSAADWHRSLTLLLLWQVLLGCHPWQDLLENLQFLSQLACTVCQS